MTTDEQRAYAKGFTEGAIAAERTTPDAYLRTLRICGWITKAGVALMIVSMLAAIWLPWSGQLMATAAVCGFTALLAQIP